MVMLVRKFWRFVGAAILVLLIPQVSLASAESENVSFTTADGVKLVGTIYLPKNGKDKVPGILLLHQYSRDRTTWSPLIPQLLKEGYAILAIDLRGHGESTSFGDEFVTYERFSDTDFAGMIEDVRSSIKYLKSQRRVNPERLAIIGASIGANLALQYSAEDKNVRTIVLLSPGENYRGLLTLPYLDKYSRRALFIVASEGDVYSAESSKKLKEYAKLASPCKLKLYPGKAHGTDLLLVQDGLGSIIVAWLQNHLPNG